MENEGEGEIQGGLPQGKARRYIATRGIPSKESFYLPAHYSPELRKFQDDGENMLRNYWSVEELINFIFPKKYQPTYNEIADKFMRELLQRHRMEGSVLSRFVRSNALSKATFYNRVLPRMKRVGLIKVERETISPEHSKRKYRPMSVSLSKTFGNYLCKIGESWLAIIDDAKSRPPKHEDEVGGEKPAHAQVQGQESAGVNEVQS